MQLNRVIAIIMVATLGISCSSNSKETERQEEYAISMSPASQAYTRALMNSFGDSPSSISLFGRTMLSSQTAMLFNNTTLSYINSPAEGWTYSPLKYWDYQKTYDFVAMYPYDATNLTYDSNTNVLTYNTSYVSSLNNQTDLMWAAASRNPATQGKGAVNLMFNHALSAIKFSLINSSNDPVNVTDIYITDIDDTATTLTINNGTSLGWSAVSQSATNIYPVSAWSHGDVNVNTEKKYDFYNSAVAPQVGDDSYLLCIPQTVAGSSATLHFTVNTGSTQQVFAFSLADCEEVPAWQAGKRYSYTLTLVDNKITFVASVVDWIDNVIDLQ